MKKIFNGKAILSILMALVLFSSTFVMSYAASDTTVQISVTGTFDYAKAQEVLKMVNKERKADGKGSLKLSAELTKVAMQRAAECAVNYSHTRPNGKDCFTILNFHATSLGENIAAGDVVYTSEDIMDMWMNSQGHRANILKSSFDSIGIGVFYQEDAIYWVQMFSGGATTTTLTKNKAEKGTAKIDILKSNLELSCYLNKDISVGEKGQVSVYTTNQGFRYYDTKIDSTCFNFKSSKTSVAKIDSKGNVTAVSAGKTTITATMKSCNLSAKTSVTVSKGYELKKVYDEWRCYKNNDYILWYCGLVKHTNGIWYYVQDGRVNFSKTGLVKHTDGKWYYVKDGRWDKTKTGLVKHTDKKWYYVKSGVVDFSKTGLVEHTDGKWYYVEKGKVASTKTGLFKHSNGKWYYVKNGTINWSKTGLVKHTDGKWYYVEKGRINFSKTGYVKHTDGKRYYVKNGVYPSK
ncbi:MAG: Ig-like domain-containing protein [Clostridia bacterium]|nr:Ig-like domain-containing protein [Clostridia bacterium]